MSKHEYSQGICGDSAAILEDVQPMTPEEIVHELQCAQERIAVQNEKLDSADHFAAASTMVPKGNASLIGDFIDEEGNAFCRAIVLEFDTIEEFLAARRLGQCRFSLFGGDV